MSFRDAIGHIYVATNKSFPGLVKIGYTKKEPAKRIKQLDSTSVPTPFELYGSVPVNYPDQAESKIHKLLKSKRVEKGREFFRMSPAAALQFIKENTFDVQVDEAKYKAMVDAEKARKRQQRFEEEVREELKTLRDQAWTKWLHNPDVNNLPYCPSWNGPYRYKRENPNSPKGVAWTRMMGNQREQIEKNLAVLNELWAQKDQDQRINRGREESKDTWKILLLNGAIILAAIIFSNL